MLGGIRARYRRIPEFTCHSCGYDMGGREPDEVCPECSTPFDPDTNHVPNVVLGLNIVIGSCVLAILGMVFLPPLAILSLILWSFLGRRWGKLRHLGRHRVNERVWVRVWLIHVLIWWVIIQLLVLMIADTIYPSLFDWW